MEKILGKGEDLRAGKVLRGKGGKDQGKGGKDLREEKGKVPEDGRGGKALGGGMGESISTGKRP